MIRHPECVSPELMSVLRELSALPVFAQFVLGGGTALALQFGHRSSIDIDLFSTGSFDSAVCRDAISMAFPEAEIVNQTPGSLCALIDHIKVDILRHSYPQLRDPLLLVGFSLVSLPDSAAMKVNEVTNRIPAT
ncbi:MAG: hypothetical protein A2001_20775 [Treponema sp. GWC1_61_84]|nr:MAG: hypothetical protein A2001_20775 [Treponema sp. GWC1_61_84]